MLQMLPKRIANKIKVDDRTGCWLWLGNKSGKGYGRIFWKGKVARAHRVIYEIVKSPIPSGLLICHHCDVPACVNPEHLYAGTHVQNQRDKINRGRWRGCPKGKGQKRPGSLNPFSKLTEDDVRAIRASALNSLVLAKEYSVSPYTIRSIRRRESWTHV